MSKRKSKNTELLELNKNIQNKREYLDELIADFNRDNSSVDEKLIKKNSKELKWLIETKEELENKKNGL